MKIVANNSAISTQVSSVFAIAFMLLSFNSQAQTQSQSQTQSQNRNQTQTQNQNQTQNQAKPQSPTLQPMDLPGDTVDIIQYNNDLNFDAKRSIIYSDKRTVDSLANELAANEKVRCHIVFRRQGKQAKEISHKELSKLDRSGLYRIMIAYNKKGRPEDDLPIYILTSK